MTPPRTRAAAEPSEEVRRRYRDALVRLFVRRRFGMRPGLEVAERLFEELGAPQRTFPAVHVTGSKGKGSVAGLTAAILHGHGRRTGLYTSPHLASYRERIRIDDATATHAEVVEGLATVEAAAERLLARRAIDRAPTFFEVTTALAFERFRDARVDAAVVEVGLGGRLDATNVLNSRVGVLTTVELEHTEILGDTVGAIAEEKAGILHAGMTAVVGELPPAAAERVERTADRLGVPVWHLGREIRVSRRELYADGQELDVRLPGISVERIRLPLLGTFQAGNTALALAAAARFLSAEGIALDAERTRRALASVRVAGRLERLARSPDLFADVAHTPESARALAQSVAEVAPLADPSGSVVVFGCLEDKRVDPILDALAPLASTIVLVPVRSERAAPVGALRPAAVAHFPRVVLAPGVREGVALARAATAADGVTVVTGSDYLVGELVRGPESADEPDLSDPGRSGPRSATGASERPGSRR